MTRRDALRLSAGTVVGLLGVTESIGRTTRRDQTREAIGGSLPATPPRREEVPAPQACRVLKASDVIQPAVAISDDGGRLLTGDRDGILRTWDLTSGRLLDAFEAHEHPISRIALARDGSRLAMAGPSRLVLLDGAISQSGFYEGCIIKVWELDEKKLVGSTTSLGWRSDLAMAFSPDDDHVLFVAGDRPKSLRIERGFEPSHQDLDRVNDEDPDGIPLEVAFGVDSGRTAAILNHPTPGEAGRILKLWDDTQEHLVTLEEIEGWVGKSLGPLALSPDGKRIVISSVGIPLDERHLRLARPHRLLTVMDFDRGEMVRQLQTQPGVISGSLHLLAFSPDGARVVSAGDRAFPPGEDVILQVWDVESGRELGAFRGPKGCVRAVSFLPGRRLRVVSGGDRYLTDDRGQITGVDPLKVWEVELPAP